MISTVKKVLALVLTVTLSIAIGLLIGEFIIRKFFPQVTSPIQFFYDEKLGGVVPVPNQKGFKKFPDVYYYEYQNNDIGMRDTRNVADYQKYAKRILCIGDSFTYGWGVNDNETFCRILEKKINKDSIAVLNAGTSGVGTDYALKFLRVRGTELNPNTVIYFCFDNDMTDNKANAYFHIKNDSIIDNDQNSFNKANALKKNNLINNRIYNWLSSYSQLFGMIRYNIGLIWNRKVQESNESMTKTTRASEKVSARIPAQTTADSTKGVLPVSTMNQSDPLYYTYKYIEGTDKEAKKLKAKFLVFYIPSHTSLKEFQKSGSIAVEKSLQAYCEKKQIGFFSFTNEIIKVKNPVSSLYLPVDYHWNKNGHALAAEYLNQVLKQNGIIP